MKYIIKQEQNSCREYPIFDRCTIGALEFFLVGEQVIAAGTVLEPYAWNEIQESYYLLRESSFQTYERQEKLFIADNNADVNLPGCSTKILVDRRKMIVESASEMRLYLNQEKISDGIYELEEGAELLIDRYKLVLTDKSVKIWNADCQIILHQIADDEKTDDGFPVYKRSPRLIKKIAEETIKIDIPKEDKGSAKKEILQAVLPPLGMLLITVVIGIVMKRGLYMLMSIGATLMTTIFTVVKFFQDKKELRETKKRKRELFKKYILGKRKEAYYQWESEREAYHYNYPEMKELEEQVEHCSSRIYERSNMDDDFLAVSIGHFLGAPALKIDDKTTGMEVETNEYLEEAQSIKRKYSMIERPQIIDLKRAHLGLVGEKSVIHEQLKLLMGQLTFFQSYHDVQLITIYDSAYTEDFRWMRWLSHTRLQGLNVLGMIRSEKTRDQVLSSMQQILKERRQKVEEEKKEAKFLPHYIFILDEPKMIMDHSIMEFLEGDNGQKLGFSIIYTSNQRANLPENIGTILLLDNSEEGELLLEEKELRNQKVMLQRLDEVDMEMFARNLGVLQHEQGMTNHIPESITFFEMYNIRNPEELQVQSRWQKNHSSKTLSVPLGARAKDDILEMNLHEKAHGPHGLVAGTTGSGKSEIVQSYIVSLAANFHPYEVGFLLIDYKGGGMANLFKNLPHLLGTITNLDGSESMRALASIQSELRRRQQMFGEFEVNHINAYSDLFREGKAKEPIPHLFIISDEFAELKKEQPEFMKELVSTARIGRSLGVHLILATQKPTGVVDDQIWTNSKFKLCLKVQNEADSKEVLHTPDAANITRPGLAYLQVGNNDVYELFQSAWSGAAYIKETDKEVTQDERVYFVNELGQGELINQDLRGSMAERKAKETQLDVVVNHIKDVYDKENHIEVKKPWLPSLPDKMVNPDMDIKGAPKIDLNVVIGKRDVPEEQKQLDCIINLAAQGNIVYIASGGYGKSFFLANVILNLAAKNLVSNLNFYVLDFGNNALISLSKIPHMADYIMLDEEEKFAKFRDLISVEIKNRKKKMAAAMAQNYTVYNETADEPMKAIVIAIDNYDAVKEMGYEMEEYFTRITRDGAGIGIYVIVTASRNSAIRFATLNNFKNKIAGVNFDENEVKTLVGRSPYSLPEIRGRAMIKSGENVNIMQIYTPVDFADEVDYSKKIQSYVNEIIVAYPGDEAPHIPMLPEELSYPALFGYQGDETEISIGLDKDSVIRTGIMRHNSPFLLLGESGSGKTNAMGIILPQLMGSRIHVFDAKSRGLYEFKDQVNYIMTVEQLEDFANNLNAETKRRKQEMDEALKGGKHPQEIVSGFEPIYILIDDIDDFCELAGTNLTVLANWLEQAASYGSTFIVGANTNKFKGSDNFTKWVKTARNGLLLSSQGYLTIFPVKVTEYPAKPDGYLMAEGVGRYVRIPEYNFT